MAVPSFILGQIEDGYAWAKAADDFTEVQIQYIRNHWPTSGYHQAVAYTLMNLQDTCQFLIYANIWRAGAYRVPLAFSYCNGDGDITLDDILTAMVTAAPEQVRYFIGVVDAYRQSVWNKPFNAGFYAALARGFG